MAFRIGESGSEYGFPEALVGTIPGWLGTQKALQLIGPSKLKNMIFTGTSIPAEEALDIGLIDHLVPAGEGVDKARELISQIARTSPISVSLGKQIVNSLASNQPATWWFTTNREISARSWGWSLIAVMS